MAPELAAHHFFMLASSSGVAFGHLLAQSSSVVLQEIGTLRTRKPPPPPLQPLRESGTSLGRPCAGNWRAEAHESSTIANGAPRIRVAGRRQLTRVLARGFIWSGADIALADYARCVVGEGCEETLRADSHAPGVQRGPDSVLRHR